MDAHRSLALVDNAALALFSLPDLKSQHTPTGHSNAVDQVAVCPRHQRVASTDGKTLKVWDAESGALCWSRVGRIHDSLQFSPDGQQLLTTVDRRLQLLDVASGEPRSSAEVSMSSSVWRADGTIRHVSYDEEEEGVTLVFAEGPEARVLGTMTSEYVRCIPVLSANGATALVWSDMEAYGWDLEAGRRLWEQSLELSAATLSPGGEFAALALIAERDVHILNQLSGKLVARIPTGSDQLLHCLQWSPGGDRLVVAVADTLLVFEIDIWRLRASRDSELLSVPTTRLAGGHRGDVMSLGFSADGALLASGGADGSVCLWRLAPLSG